MSGVLPVIHETFPPFTLPDRAITLIDGRRFGTVRNIFYYEFGFV